MNQKIKKKHMDNITVSKVEIYKMMQKSDVREATGQDRISEFK